MKRVALYCSLVLLSVQFVWADRAPSLLDFTAVDIGSGEAFQLADRVFTVPQPSLVLFFEPNCSWCYKQAKVFDQLAAACPQLTMFGLGVNGSRVALQKEAWRLRVTFPLWMASQSMLASTGPIKTTPLSLLLDDAGKIIFSARGYMDAARWREALIEHGVKLEQQGSAADCQLI